jgi:hypothetical protein
MRQKLTRKRIILLSVAAAVALLLLDAFVAPPAHDIHSLSGVAIKARVVASITRFDFVPITPSQSLADIRCQLWHADFRNPHRADPCPDAATLALSYWSQLTQNPATLYVGWLPCGSYSSLGGVWRVGWLQRRVRRLKQNDDHSLLLRATLGLASRPSWYVRSRTANASLGANERHSTWQPEHRSRRPPGASFRGPELRIDAEYRDDLLRPS